MLLYVNKTANNAHLLGIFQCVSCTHYLILFFYNVSFYNACCFSTRGIGACFSCVIVSLFLFEKVYMLYTCCCLQQRCRRKWDSNPWYRKLYVDLANQCLQPLSHSSFCCVCISMWSVMYMWSVSMYLMLLVWLAFEAVTKYVVLSSKHCVFWGGVCA